MSKRADPVKKVVDNVKKSKITFRLFDAGDNGWMIDTGTGNPFIASPFEVLLWERIQEQEKEIKELQRLVRLTSRGQQS